MSHSPPPSPNPAAQGPSEPARQQLLGEHLQRNGLRFEVGVLEQLVQRSPEDLELLAALAQSCAMLGAHKRGLELDQRLVSLRPEDETFRYNLACSLCLLNDLDAACGALLAALDRGYRDFTHLLADGDLAALRSDFRFCLIRDRIASLARDH